MALAPSTVLCIPQHLQRSPMIVFEPAPTVAEPLTDPAPATRRNSAARGRPWISPHQTRRTPPRAGAMVLAAIRSGAASDLKLRLSPFLSTLLRAPQRADPRSAPLPGIRCRLASLLCFAYGYKFVLNSAEARGNSTTSERNVD